MSVTSTPTSSPTLSMGGPTFNPPTVTTTASPSSSVFATAPSSAFTTPRSSIDDFRSTAGGSGNVFFDCPPAPSRGGGPRRRRRPRMRSTCSSPPSPGEPPFATYETDDEDDDGFEASDPGGSPVKKLRRSPAVTALAVFTSLAFAESQFGGELPSKPAESTVGEGSSGGDRCLGDAFREEPRPTSSEPAEGCGTRNGLAAMNALRIGSTPTRPRTRPVGDLGASPPRTPRRPQPIGRRSTGLGLGRLGAGLESESESEGGDKPGWDEPPPPYAA